MLPALVLTAGFGRRLDPLTRLVAKPAVPVAGRPLVERVLDWLAREGVRDVVLNLHHRPASITGIVGDGAHLGLRVRYSWEQPLLGSAGGPRHALPLLDAGTFLIVNGDTLCDVALAPMVAAHDASGADVTMALVPNAAPDRYNSVLLDASDRVRGFAPKGPRPIAGAGEARGWHFVGVQVARAALFAPFADGVPAETVAGLYRDGIASASLALHGFRTETPFHDVGTPADYRAACLRLAGAGRAIEAGARVAASARVDGAVVWADAEVGAADVRGCVVAGPVRVPDGYAARDAVIVPASVTRPGDRAAMHDGVAAFHYTD